MKITKINSLPQAIKQKRVAAYVRVSNDKDAMRHSMSAQISYYNNYISKRIEWSFAGIYADDPVSGTKDNRIEFQRMISDCRTGKIDMIIAKSITRFARNTLTTLEVVRELKVLGIDVFFEKENIHSISGDGELLLSILASYAQEESRSVSENCKWRIKRMFEAGRSNSCTMLGYRLQDSKFYIVPEEAAIVKQIYEDYLSGMGPVAIAKKLFFAGTPTRKGGTWSKSSIAHILTNEKYMGDMILQKTFSQDHISKRKRINQGELPKYYVQNSHEAIIPKEMFERVQQEIKRRSKKPLSPDYTNPTYPFSNIIICEKCGKHYIHRSTALGTKYNKSAWICTTYNTLGKTVCDSHQIPEKILISKAAEALGLSEFDENIFKEQIAEIHIPTHSKLVFIFHDGSKKESSWQYPSRRESWTPEMKQAARERQIKINKERK